MRSARSRSRKDISRSPTTSAVAPRDLFHETAIDPRNSDSPETPQPGQDPPDRKRGRSYWDRVDNLFYDTISRAKSAFRVILVFNAVIVAVGVTLVGSSIAYSFVKGADPLSAGLAAAGIADFVAVLFVGPQRYVEEAVRNLTRVQVVYRAYLMAIEAVSDYNYYQSKNPSRAWSDVVATTSKWEDLAQTALTQLGESPEAAPISGAGGSSQATSGNATGTTPTSGLPAGKS